MGTYIINSGRCSHAKCIFCGYGRIRGMQPNEVTKHMDEFFKTLVDDEVKVFGSGSFLDEKQIPKNARKHFIQLCKDKKVAKITIESRPEFVNAEILAEFKGLNLTVAVGLESADNFILDKLKKGYKKEDFQLSSEIVRKSGYKVRTYLLVNPPYAGDIAESLDKSVEYALKHSDSIVLINMLPHSNAPLMKMWTDGMWNYLSKKEFDEITEKYKNNPKIEYDAETFRFTPNFPETMQENIVGVGEWQLTHPHFEVFQDYINRWYEPQTNQILLFLPCSYKKPYSESQTHKKIIQKLNEVGRNNFHEVMLSNAGVIPRNLENKYPFTSYDWNESEETPQIKERYIQVTRERIKRYLKSHMKSYKAVVCYLKYSAESYIALEMACKESGIKLKNLLKYETYQEIKDSPQVLQNELALNDFKEGLRWCLQNFT